MNTNFDAEEAIKKLAKLKVDANCVDLVIKKLKKDSHPPIPAELANIQVSAKPIEIGGKEE